MSLRYAGGCHYDILDGNARMAVALRRCCHILVTENSYTSFNVILVYYSCLFTCIALCTISLSHNLLFIVARCGYAGVGCAALICQCGVCGVNMPVWGVRR